jgi:predicted HicB family RNase H-like nuclease
MSRLIPIRPNKNVIFSSEHKITTYDDEKRIFYQPITDVTNSIEAVKAMVKKRYREYDFSNKHILNFEWEKLIP